MLRRGWITTLWSRIGLLIILAMVLSAVPIGAASPADDNWPEWKGLVESRPAGTNIGDWVVGGRTFTADASTQFDEEHGTLDVGVCAKVKYQTVASGYRAVEIESKEASDCMAGGEGENKVYGRIDSMPAGGLVGIWVIDGTSYEATASTQFEQEHGGFDIGVCVEVEYIAGTPPTATKIGTEHDYKCSGGGGGGGGTEPSGEMYGVIESFPPGLIGTWVIGGMEFEADASTQFEQEHAAFDVGVTVEVKFYTDAAGVNHATKIETKFDNDNGDDDDGNGAYDGAEGHAYGLIDAFPPGLIGEWIIGGIPYTATADTRFEQEHGAFAVGVNVKVKYYLDASNNRIARKIKTTDDRGDVSDPTHFKLVGYVQQMPAMGFNGQWVVNNVTLMADQTTKFKETHGLLAVGAYVEVEYYENAGVNWIHEIETEVPPGAGPNNGGGEIQDLSGAAAASVSATGVWVIGGKSYLVTPATDLNDLNAALTVGSTAVVNSYTAPDSTEVATRISGVNVAFRAWLPMMSH